MISITLLCIILKSQPFFKVPIRPYIVHGAHSYVARFSCSNTTLLHIFMFYTRVSYDASIIEHCMMVMSFSTMVIIMHVYCLIPHPRNMCYTPVSNSSASYQN